MSVRENRCAASWRLVCHVAACDYPSTIPKNRVAKFSLSERVFRSSVANASTPGSNTRLIDHPLVSAFALWFGFVRVEKPICCPSFLSPHDRNSEKNKDRPRPLASRAHYNSI